MLIATAFSFVLATLRCLGYVSTCAYSIRQAFVSSRGSFDTSSLNDEWVGGILRITFTVRRATVWSRQLVVCLIL